MKTTILISLFFITTLTFGQCYVLNYELGKAAYLTNDIAKAESLFNAAKLCQDAPTPNDLDEWINKCKNYSSELLQEEKAGDLVIRWAKSVTDSQKETIREIVNNLIHVKGGTFMMGSNSILKEEKPMHRVNLTSFNILKYEVKQSQYLSITGSNPSDNKNLKYPVENITFFEAQKFCVALTEMTGLKFSLPTESQWEYAAKGGELSKGFKYAGSDSIKIVANTMSPIGGEIAMGCSKEPNELGLYDMSGNVSEWCLDNWSYYTKEEKTDPKVLNTTSSTVIRGGNWASLPLACRVTARAFQNTTKGSKSTGFRIVVNQ